VIQNARMLQCASGEDVQLLLSVARHALSAEADTSEELELSRGRSQADVRLVHAGDEVVGALVSLERGHPARGNGSGPLRGPGQDCGDLRGIGHPAVAGQRARIAQRAGGSGAARWDRDRG
jgi:hypothetical protein